MNNSNAVLVVGSAGRIGQAVVAELKLRGLRVRGFDCQKTPALDDVMVGDITDGEAVKRAATGVGTLKEVHQGPKGPCAKVEVHIRVPLRTIKNGEHNLDLSEGSGSTLDAVYDFALDGNDSHYAAAMQMKFLATGSNPESDGTQSRVRIELGIELREQR